VDYRTVQQKITDKYDMWHKQILSKFGNMLAGSQEEFYSTVSKVQLVSTCSMCALTNFMLWALSAILQYVIWWLCCRIVLNWRTTLLIPVALQKLLHLSLFYKG